LIGTKPTSAQIRRLRSSARCRTSATERDAGGAGWARAGQADPERAMAARRGRRRSLECWRLCVRAAPWWR
jgi:hypothetical protein